MLPAQVSYWQLQESKRHNLTAEQQARNELAETSRHNIVSEEQNAENLRLGWSSLAETTRHNQAMETETHRANVARENISLFTAQEQQRHNVSTESISVRGQNLDYQLGYGNLEVNRTNAATNRMNAQTNAMNAQTNRLNSQISKANAYTGYVQMTHDYKVQTQKLENESVRNQIELYKAQTSRELGYYNVMGSISGAVARTAASTVNTLDLAGI